MKSVYGIGKKVALRLGPFFEALAPDASRANGNLRLQHLVARPLRIIARIDEAGEPRLLIGLENLAARPDSGHQNSAHCNQDQALPQVDSAQKQACHQNRRIGERRAQVRLDQHQDHGNSDQGKGLEDLLPGQVAAAKIGEVARHGEISTSLTHSEGWNWMGPMRSSAARPGPCGQRASRRPARQQKCRRTTAPSRAGGDSRSWPG